MVRRSLLALILVVSAFQLLAVMRASTVVAAPPAVPFALTETAEPPTPVPPTNTPVPPATDTPVPIATTPAVPPTFTPLPTTEPRDTPTPQLPAGQPTATPSQSELTQTLIAGTEIAGGSPTPTLTPTATPAGGNTEPTPGKLPRTADDNYSSPLLWLGIAVLAVAIGTRLRRRNA